MVDYREILRLQSLGYNITQIAGSLHSSRNTVREVERLADEKGIRWPLGEEVTNPQLYVLLYPEQQEKANVYLEPDCAWIHRELAKKGVNLTLLWKEYQVNCSNVGRVPYQYTQFCDIYRAWAKKSKATMRIHHKPGDAMEVDWAGGTLSIKDPITGETVLAYLFVGVLPCSCYVYAELCSDMKSENWLLCHVHAYEYFGGVPRLTVPDNLRTGVLKNTRMDTVLNRSYSELGSGAAPAGHISVDTLSMPFPKESSMTTANRQCRESSIATGCSPLRTPLTKSIPVIMKKGSNCVSRRKNLFWRLSGRGSISRSPSGIPGWIKQ